MTLELIDVVTKVELHGFEPVYAIDAEGYWQRVGWTAGRVVVHYSRGPASSFKVRPSKVDLDALRTWPMHKPRGRVLEAIEAAIERAEGPSQMRKNLEELAKAKGQLLIEPYCWFK